VALRRFIYPLSGSLPSRGTVLPKSNGLNFGRHPGLLAIPALYDTKNFVDNYLCQWGISTQIRLGCA